MTAISTNLYAGHKWTSPKQLNLFHPNSTASKLQAIIELNQIYIYKYTLYIQTYILL